MHASSWVWACVSLYILWPSLAIASRFTALASTGQRSRGGSSSWMPPCDAPQWLLTSFDWRVSRMASHLLMSSTLRPSTDARLIRHRGVRPTLQAMQAPSISVWSSVSSWSPLCNLIVTAYLLSSTWDNYVIVSRYQAHVIAYAASWPSPCRPQSDACEGHCTKVCPSICQFADCCPPVGSCDFFRWNPKNSQHIWSAEVQLSSYLP